MSNNDLSDDTSWTSNDGETRDLADMEPGHRSNLLAWLERNAAGLHASEMLGLVSGAMPDPDTHAYDMVMGSWGNTVWMEPTAWLLEQPLYVRLKELVTQDRATARRVQEMARGYAAHTDPLKSKYTRLDPEALKAERERRQHQESVDQVKGHLRDAEITTSQKLSRRQASERKDVRFQHKLEREAMLAIRSEDAREKRSGTYRITGPDGADSGPIPYNLAPGRTPGHHCNACGERYSQCLGKKLAGHAPCCLDCATLPNTHGRF